MSKLQDIAVIANSALNEIDIKKADYLLELCQQKDLDIESLEESAGALTQNRFLTSITESDARKAAVAAELVTKEAKLAGLLGVEGDIASETSVWGVIAWAADVDADTTTFLDDTSQTITDNREAYFNSIGSIADFTL